MAARAGIIILRYTR